jgi:iron-sulfur cluster repair protein YtfE (RIC family)
MLVESGTLAEHHRRCDALFGAARAAAAAADWRALAERMNELREALLSHFRYEEERIFPLYEETARAEGSTQWLCAQHDDMRGTLWSLATVTPEEAPARYCAELAELQAAFAAHAADEEGRMYPVFERVLGR